MRRPLVVVVIVVAAACASSTLPQSETFGASPETVWRAAMVAVGELGGRVVMSEHSGRYILGRLEDTALGSTVNLDISIRDWMDGAEVRVKASTPDSPDGVNLTREDALRQLEQDYLDLVRRLTGGIRTMR